MLPRGGSDAPSISSSNQSTGVFHRIRRKFRRKAKPGELFGDGQYWGHQQNSRPISESLGPTTTRGRSLQKHERVKSDFDYKDEIWDMQMAERKQDGEAKLLGRSVISLVLPYKNTIEEALCAEASNSKNRLLNLPTEIHIQILTCLVPDSDSPPNAVKDRRKWLLEREKFSFELQSLRLSCRAYFYMIPAWRCEPSQDLADRYRRVNRIEYYRFFRQLAAKSEMKNHPRLYVCSGCWKVQLSWRGYGFDRGVGGPLCETCNETNKFIWRPPAIT